MNCSTQKPASATQTMRSIRLNAFMSNAAKTQALTKLPRLTSQETADRDGDLIVWVAIPGQTTAINLISPHGPDGLIAPGAGNTYTIRYDANKGLWRCSCKAGRDGKQCWHIIDFTRNQYDFLKAGTISYSNPDPDPAPVPASPNAPSVYSVAINAPKSAGFGSKAEFDRHCDQDFG